MKKIKKYIGEILLISGSFITTYELFSFKSDYFGYYEKSLLHLPSLPMPERYVVDPAVFYYYNNQSVFLLSLGVALIVLGILIIKNKNG